MKILNLKSDIIKIKHRKPKICPLWDIFLVDMFSISEQKDRSRNNPASIFLLSLQQRKTPG